MENLSRNLLLVSRKAQLCIRVVAEKYNLTMAEQPFFMAIRANDGMTQEDYTALVGVDKAMTTRALRSLERKGLIRRVQDPNDRRHNRIYKTEQAKKIEAAVLSDLLALNHRFTEGISEEELAAFLRTLARIDVNVSNQFFTGGDATSNEETR